MSYKIDAIYENGVFRPLQPVDLPEGTRAVVTVDIQVDESDAAIEGRRAAIAKLFKDLDSLPQTPNDDGWSAKDHDDLLYGPRTNP